jgi:hypothetical protein
MVYMSLTCYPIALHHRDKPDFEFKCGPSTIGVEITEAIPQNLAAADALSERESPNALIEICHFKAGAKKKTAEELREIVTQKKLTGSGWADDEPEEEWAQAIQENCWEKTRKLCAPSFFKYPENWLVIYDNLSLPMELQKSVDYLIKNLSDYWEQSTIYDALLIESECEIIKLNSRSRVAWTIEDLWGPA